MPRAVIASRVVALLVATHSLLAASSARGEMDRWFDRKPCTSLTIEKHRNGQAGIDMEFFKRFEQSRFDTEGRIVAEQLTDERVFVE